LSFLQSPHKIAALAALLKEKRSARYLSKTEVCFSCLPVCTALLTVTITSTQDLSEIQKAQNMCQEEIKEVKKEMKQKFHVFV